MKLLLHAEHVVRYHRHRREHPGTYGDLQERWYVCPNCCWVSCTVTRAHMPEPPNCGRPGHDNMTFLVNVFKADRCGPTLWVDAEAPRVADSLSAALRLGGPNAVIQILDGLDPIVLGIMGETKPSFFDFGGMRPKSVPEAYGWFATSHPSGKVQRKR